MVSKYMEDLAYRLNDKNVISFDMCLKEIKTIHINILKLLFDKIIKTFNYNNNSMKISFLGKGAQGNVYLVNTSKCGYIVLKISKCDKTCPDIEMIPKIKKIVDKHIAPNFLYYYDIIQIGDYELTLSEYANGTLIDWLKNEHTVDEWKSFLFQFLIGVYCIQNNLKAYHSDLKPKNVFYKNLLKNIYLKYEFSSGKVFTVPTFNYLFVIADTGGMQSLLLPTNKLNSNSIKMYIDSNIDLEYIVALYKKILVSALGEIYKFNINDLLEIINKKNDVYFNQYFEDKKKEIDEENPTLNDYLKNKILFNSVGYYIVEKKYIDIDDITNKNLKLPPKEIITYFHSLEKKYMNVSISDLLADFAEFQHTQPDGMIVNFYCDKNK